MVKEYKGLLCSKMELKEKAEQGREVLSITRFL